MLYIRKLIFCQKSKIHYFWYRKRKSLVKLIDTYLISSAMPFFLSDLFFRSLFHIENTEWTILCMESRLRAAFANGFNHAYCPMVSVEANTHRQGTIVMPCRGEDEWLNFGWSNIIKAELMRGRNIITVQRIGYLGTELPVLLQSIRISKK